MIAYHNKEYARAAEHLERAVALWKMRGGHAQLGWEEAMLTNLGHAQRKLGQYDAAVSSLEQALALSNSAETHAALAFTHHLYSNLDMAIQHYHHTLALLPHHAFATHMLSVALAAL